MNKWMKYGMTGLVVSSALQASAERPGPVNPSMSEALQEVAIDVLDLAGGSKLKDRMVVKSDDHMVLVYALMYS